MVQVSGQALSGPWLGCRLGLRLCEPWGWRGAWWSRWLRRVMHWCWGSGYLRVLWLYHQCQAWRQTETGHSEWMSPRHCHCKAGHYVSGMALRYRPGIGIWCDARRWRSPYVRGFLQRWSLCSSNGHYEGRSLCRAWGYWISPSGWLCTCVWLGCMSVAFSCTFCRLLVWSRRDAACAMSSSMGCGSPCMIGDVVWGETSSCKRGPGCCCGEWLHAGFGYVIVLEIPSSL